MLLSRSTKKNPSDVERSSPIPTTAPKSNVCLYWKNIGVKVLHKAFSQRWKHGLPNQDFLRASWKQAKLCNRQCAFTRNVATWLSRITDNIKALKPVFVCKKHFMTTPNKSSFLPAFLLCGVPAEYPKRSPAKSPSLLKAP